MTSQRPAGQAATDTAPDPLVAERRAALRRASWQLFIGVASLHAAAFLLYYAFDIAHRSAQTRTIFVAVWTFATALTVAFLLRRVRAVRRMGLPPLGRRPRSGA